MPAQPAIHPLDAGKPAAQLLAERTQRLADVVKLKQPDRIPVFLYFGNLLAEMGGVTRQALYEDSKVATQELHGTI